MPHCSLAAKILPTIGCLCALPCLWFGIPLLLWPVGGWITWGDNSFELKCGNQWIVDVYYSPQETELSCRSVALQVTVEFTGTPPPNSTDPGIIVSLARCPGSNLQTSVVTDGSNADKGLETEDLTRLGSLSYYTKTDPVACWPGGVYKVNSPGAKLWVKEIGLTTGFNTLVQSLGITVFLGGAFTCIGFWGCLGSFVFLLSEKPPDSQLQIQAMQMQQMGQA